MNRVHNFKDICIARIRRNTTAFQRPGRRERVQITTLTVVVVCCFLLLGAYHQNSQSADSQVDVELPDAKDVEVTRNHADANYIADDYSKSQNWKDKTQDISKPIDSSDYYRQYSENPASSQSDTETKDKVYIEVLDTAYHPKQAAMPSWLPRPDHGSKWDASSIARLTNESRIILENNKEVSPHTLEPEPDSLLILTPVKNNAKHLARYFALIDKLKYPRNKVSIAFLVSDSTDRTQQMLIESRQWYQETAPADMRFKRFEIYRQDFFYALPRHQRHLREKQQERRIMMAKARNYLWTRALENEQWVLWIDGDLEFYPPNIVRDLMSYDKDVIVPNCLVRRKADKDRWKHSVYDRNAWQETPESLAMIKKLEESAFLVEGYKSLRTHRKYLDNFSKNQTIVPLDGVGGTFTLVKAHVHRSGVGFPAWLFQHQVETEGFAKLAKAHGYGVFGLPFYYIRHVVG